MVSAALSEMCCEERPKGLSTSGMARECRRKWKGSVGPTPTVDKPALVVSATEGT